MSAAGSEPTMISSCGLSSSGTSLSSSANNNIIVPAPSPSCMSMSTSLAQPTPPPPAAHWAPPAPPAFGTTIIQKCDPQQLINGRAGKAPQTSQSRRNSGGVQCSSPSIHNHGHQTMSEASPTQGFSFQSISNQPGGSTQPEAQQETLHNETTSLGQSLDISSLTSMSVGGIGEAHNATNTTIGSIIANDNSGLISPSPTTSLVPQPTPAMSEYEQRNVMFGGSLRTACTSDSPPPKCESTTRGTPQPEVPATTLPSTSPTPTTINSTTSTAGTKNLTNNRQPPQLQGIVNSPRQQSSGEQQRSLLMEVASWDNEQLAAFESKLSAQTLLQKAVEHNKKQQALNKERQQSAAKANNNNSLGCYVDVNGRCAGTPGFLAPCYDGGYTDPNGRKVGEPGFIPPAIGTRGTFGSSTGPNVTALAPLDADCYDENYSDHNGLKPGDIGFTPPGALWGLNFGYDHNYRDSHGRKIGDVGFIPPCYNSDVKDVNGRRVGDKNFIPPPHGKKGDYNGSKETNLTPLDFGCYDENYRDANGRKPGDVGFIPVLAAKRGCTAATATQQFPLGYDSHYTDHFGHNPSHAEFVPPHPTGFPFAVGGHKLGTNTTKPGTQQPPERAGRDMPTNPPAASWCNPIGLVHDDSGVKLLPPDDNSDSGLSPSTYNTILRLTPPRRARMP
eukprot:TRINITY_DN63660_c0_g2_i2.p1 TRINITY_DN63660_c0_g2~~TRINITY_DN63660_c0_g2_i2.p1  ORF type:complete len:703 (+),score=96.95 TRINITY_DN63660_c0_g2_i2:91-2109(+)